MFSGMVMIINFLNEKSLTYILAHHFKSNFVKLYLLESNLVKSILNWEVHTTHSIGSSCPKQIALSYLRQTFPSG